MQERHADDEVSTQSLLYPIQELALVVKTAEFVPNGKMDYGFLPTDVPVVFKGGISVVKDWWQRRIPLSPFTWFDFEALSCRHYYSRWPDFLVQRQFSFVKLGDLLQLKQELLARLGRDESIFIRPDTDDKAFSAAVVHSEEYGAFVDDLINSGVGLDHCCVVSRPETIQAEWRLVIADGQVITGSQYMVEGVVEHDVGYPSEAIVVAETAANLWSPHPIFDIDIGLTRDGYRIVECGSINCAGWYRCDLHSIVQAMSQIAEREFRT